MEYDEVISLGSRCQTAYQIRRLTGKTQAQVFDWMIAPHRGVVKAIETNFSDFMQLENLKRGVSASDEFKYRHIEDASYGILYQHEFLNSASLEEDYQRIKSKYDFLIGRWNETMRSESKVLFIRQAVGGFHPAIDEPEIGEQEAQELVHAISGAYPALDFRLLLLTPQARTPLRTEKYDVLTMEQPNPWDWRGDLDVWGEWLPQALASAALEEPRRQQPRHEPATQA